MNLPPDMMQSQRLCPGELSEKFRDVSNSDVSWRAHHLIYIVERYLKDFCMVFTEHFEGNTVEQMSHMTRFKPVILT